ncbi:Bax inhibitor-1/YccA family protein [Sphingomonas limnosediminicola]|uniref:Bax inhibitor-1/YccA family protein n=1 Tax=Sphingomonas limnosediminicola TaxID=940133 RepID=A0ABP7LKH8_9SPHN
MDRYYPGRHGAGAGAATYDAGLRRYMLRIYNYMAAGLTISGAVAFAVASTPALAEAIFGTPLKWVAIFAPLGFVFFLSVRMERMSAVSLRTAFYGFAAVMGVSLAALFLTFTGQSIAMAFFAAGAMFLGMSLWGYTTSADLTRFSSFLMMGLIGVVLASIANLFLASTILQLVVAIVGVLVFTGLTAWDTQRAKSDYVQFAGTPQAEKLAIWSALSLYLNLINLIQLMLTFLGQRRD